MGPNILTPFDPPLCQKFKNFKSSLNLVHSLDDTKSCNKKSSNPSDFYLWQVIPLNTSTETIMDKIFGTTLRFAILSKKIPLPPTTML